MLRSNHTSSGNVNQGSLCVCGARQSLGYSRGIPAMQRQSSAVLLFSSVQSNFLAAVTLSTSMRPSLYLDRHGQVLKRSSVAIFTTRAISQCLLWRMISTALHLRLCHG